MWLPAMLDEEDFWSLYESVPAVRVLQQLRGPEKLKVFLNSLLDGKEHLVYDADTPAWGFATTATRC